jgi:hypothetical protein
VDLGHDAAGEPFIAYDRDDPDQLRVAYRNEDTWYDQLVDEGADYEIGKLCSLVVGGDGRVHVAYRADWTIDRCCLKHAVRDEEGAWSSEVVPTASGVDQGYEPFIRLDSRDHPHIAHWCFQGSPFHGLLYTYKDDAAWHTIDIGRVLSAPSLVLDSADQPHIAACTWGSGDKTLEYMSAGGWQVLGIGGRPSIALDADDRPHIASTGTPLSYWHNDGEGWESEEICADAGAVNKRCLAIDSTGRPHVAYKIGNVVKYAYRSALGQWQTCTVFVAPADIRWQSLTMNVVDDMPRIAFSDGTTLYYCRATSMLLGDLNRDCVVDIADLAILLSNYGQWGMSEENGELTGDTLVGLDDLAMLLSVYGMTCYE